MITLNEYIKQIDAIVKKPVHNCYLLHLLHASWPDEIELVKANYSLRGVTAIIKDKVDNQEYVLEIYPK